MAVDPQHFTFEDAPFQRAIAHGGNGPIESARVLSHGAGGGAEFIDLVIVPPGRTIGEHTHGADQETYVIIEGCGAMVVDGSPITVSAGDVVVNRPGGTHALRNTGDRPLRLVVVDVALREPGQPHTTS
jgi:mannose-6-phosphate isomerase-like protein (cupin superfamily)